MYFRGTRFTQNKIDFNKLVQFFMVFIEIKKQRFVFDGGFYFFVNLFKFFGFVVRWGNIPIKIVLIKNVVDIVIRDKSNFFGIKSAQISGGHVFVESAGFANGKYKLHYRFKYVRFTLFSLCPKQRFGF